MKSRYVLLAAALVLSLSLAGCSAKNNPQNSTEPNTNGNHSVMPDTTHSDVLPGNDANEGGGAGGTVEGENGMHNDGNDNHNNINNTDNNNTDDGTLNDIGDAAGDMIEGAGDAVGDVMDGAGNAARKSGDAIGRAVRPNDY